MTRQSVLKRYVLVSKSQITTLFENTCCELIRVENPLPSNIFIPHTYKSYMTYHLAYKLRLGIILLL